MEFKGAMGGLYRLTEWITRFATTNVLWVLCSSPFLFFLITKLLLMSQQVTNGALEANWAMATLAPLTLFPATSAMFTVVRKWVMGDSDIPIFRTYFSGFKQNYKQSLLGGLFYTLLTVVMYVDYTVYMTQFQSLQMIGIVMLILLIILFVSMFNFFSMVVHYHMTIGQIIKNAILLTLFRPARIFYTLFGSTVVMYVGIRYPVLFILFIPCIIAWFAFFNFYSTFLKMQVQLQQPNGEKEENGDAAEETKN